MSENDECGLDESNPGLNDEPFDYTEWRRNLFNDMSMEEFLENARKFSESLPPPDCCK